MRWCASGAFTFISLNKSHFAAHTHTLYKCRHILVAEIVIVPLLYQYYSCRLEYLHRALVSSVFPSNFHIHWLDSLRNRAFSYVDKMNPYVIIRTFRVIVESEISLWETILFRLIAVRHRQSCWLKGKYPAHQEPIQFLFRVFKNIMCFISDTDYRLTPAKCT